MRGSCFPGAPTGEPSGTVALCAGWRGRGHRRSTISDLPRRTRVPGRTAAARVAARPEAAGGDPDVRRGGDGREPEALAGLGALRRGLDADRSVAGRAYHRVVQHYRPPADAAWREVHAAPGPGILIAHNDAAPYNAIWAASELIGFIDWDMAGPRHRDDDLAWTAFSWVPLHAEHVVRAEGFTALGRRRPRLTTFLRSYGSDLSAEDVIRRLVDLLAAQIDLIIQHARSGDDTYRRMIDAGRADDLATARDQLDFI